MSRVFSSILLVAALAITGATVSCDGDDGGVFVDILLPGNNQVVATRLGYKAKCTRWEGDVCMRPWITLNTDDITTPDPHCVDDTSSLRPLWYGDEEAQAATWCWIATGDSSFVSATTNGDDGTGLGFGGWMYGSNGSDNTVTCSNLLDFRRESDITIPGGIGVQNWSFDLMSEIRNGEFSSYECNW